MEFYSPVLNGYLQTQNVSDTRAIRDVALERGVPYAVSEYAARLCYNSVPKMGSAPHFIKGIIKREHFDVLEHTSAILYGVSSMVYSDYNKFGTLEGMNYIGNMRVWRDISWHDGFVDEFEMKRLEALFPEVFDLETKATVGDIWGESIKPYESDVLVYPLSWTQKRGSDCVRIAWLVEGLSRNATHQLVRHRLLSFSQESQRYVDAKDTASSGFVVPEGIADSSLLADYMLHCNASLSLYKRLREAGVRKEDARFVLPTAAKTRLVVSGEWVGLQHFFNLRRAKDAQWEIREVADAMYAQAQQITNDAFFDLV